MALSKQVYLYSIDTDFLYTQEERTIHEKLARLYIIRKKYSNNQYCKQFLNKIIKQHKQELSDLLDANTNKDLVRQLDTTLLTDKRVIGLFDSSLTRALNLSINQVTTELFVLNVYFFQILHDVIKNGFVYNGEKYVFFTASAGQIRTKKCVCIKESSYKRIQNTLMCGLSVEKINAAGGINPNKYLSYLALSNSATDVWDGFDIDKVIVVDDFETDVFGTVDFIDDSTYEITRQEMNVPVPHMDGAGIMLDNPTRMIRGPWLKGLLIYFPFDKFVKEKCSDGDCVVTDIWGQSYHIIADGIKYILTKSQMKLWKYYSSWAEYKEYFKKYHCEICYCNIEEEHIPKSRINYQMLQTLTDMRNDEIDRLIKPTVKEIESIGNDYKSTMRILGATDFNQAPSYFQQALQIYPELFKDKYCRSVLKDTKKSLVKKAKSGKLKVNGEYLFISPDLYAFCEWLFLGIKNPEGILKDGEVYTRQFGNNSELACLRSPHLYKEWAIRRNVKNETTNKWFGDTKCLYTSCHDLISKIIMNDNDGDKSLVVKDKLLVNVAKRNMQNIVPLYYHMKKAVGGFLNWESIYNGLVTAFKTGNIGPKSNLITIVHNNSETNREEANTVVKWLTAEVNFTIDASKTLYNIQRPLDADVIIKKHTQYNLPHFFIWAKDKSEHQVEPTNKSTMNRIADKIPSPRIIFNKNIDKFDYRMLMNWDIGFNIAQENTVVNKYNYWNTHQYLFNLENNDGVHQEDVYMYQKVRQILLNECGCDIDCIVNILVSYLYTVRPNSAKKMLWACFGDVIVKNLKQNTQTLGSICPVCGRRFQKKMPYQIYCSQECYIVEHREQDRTRKSRQRENINKPLEI